MSSRGLPLYVLYRPSCSMSMSMAPSDRAGAGIPIRWDIVGATSLSQMGLGRRYPFLRPGPLATSIAFIDPMEKLTDARY